MQELYLQNSYTIRLADNTVAIYDLTSPYEITILNGNEHKIDAIEKKNLRRLESQIIYLLLQHHGKMVSSKEIRQHCGGSEKRVTDNSVRHAIHCLRAALNDVISPYRIIKNKPKVGYSIENIVINSTLPEMIRHVDITKFPQASSTTFSQEETITSTNRFNINKPVSNRVNRYKNLSVHLRYILLLILLTTGLTYYCYSYHQCLNRSEDTGLSCTTTTMNPSANSYMSNTGMT